MYDSLSDTETCVCPKRNKIYYLMIRIIDERIQGGEGVFRIPFCAQKRVFDILNFDRSLNPSPLFLSNPGCGPAIHGVF